MCQAISCGQVWPLALLQVLQNSGCQMFMLRVKTLSAWDSHWLNPTKQYDRECSNIKECVSVHWCAKCHAKRPSQAAKGLQKLKHHVVIEPISPYLAIGLYKSFGREKMYLTGHVQQTWTYFLVQQPWTFFWVHNCCSEIAQVEYQGQTQHTRILDSKPIIWICCCIGHRLEFKYSAQFFAQCSSSSSSTSQKWELRTWKIGLIFKIKLWMTIQ